VTVAPPGREEKEWGRTISTTRRGKREFLIRQVGEGGRETDLGRERDLKIPTAGGGGEGWWGESLLEVQNGKKSDGKRGEK